jgi:hypothetical protein
LLIYFLGFVIPFEWLIAVFALLGVFIPLGIFGIYSIIRKPEETPDEQDIVALVPVDEHDTIQRGDLIGNVERSEDELYVTREDWLSDDGGQTIIPVDIAQKVPFPLKDGSGKEKRLWILRDKGHVDCVSASTIVSEKIPKRWDLPLIDVRRIFRHLEGPKTGQSITNALASKTGIITLLGIGGFFSFMTFFIITASGHLK